MKKSISSIEIDDLSTLTVLVPVFNNKIGLLKTLECLDGLNIIIYDDGSIDTERIDENQVNTICPNSSIQLIRSECNAGIALARSRLIESCSTAYGCFLDAGDYLLSKEYLYTALSILTSCRNVAVVGCWAISEKGKIKTRPMCPSATYFIYRDPIVTSGSVMNSSLAKKITIEDPTIKKNFAEDYYFFFRLRRLGLIINIASIAICREDRKDSLINQIKLQSRIFFAFLVRIKIIQEMITSKDKMSF